MPSIRDEIPDIPQSVENIILKATAKNPKNRYADAREMHEDLKTCLDESRANELKITFKYPEHDYDDTKLLKTVKETKKEEKKEIKKDNKEGEDNIAKKVNKGEKSQNKVLIILASIFVGLVVIITTIFVLIPYINSSSQSAIPDVSGYTVTEAINALQDAGFVVADEQREEASETIDEGLVTKTSPAAGSIRKEGTEITIYVSLGDITIEIENYVGENYAEVKGRLEALNLNVYVESRDIPEGDDPSDYEEGIIMAQSVEAGTKLSEGDSITLYIPSLDNKYPDFVADEYTIAEVEDFAEDYEITLNIVYEDTTEYAPGTIIRQSRAAGSTVVSGARLTITVAREPSSSEETPEDSGGLE